MKQYWYACDGGSIAIGNGLCVVCLPNDIGDGCHDFYVYDMDEELPISESKLLFLGSCEGETEVYGYDCDFGGSRRCTLKGRYGIFCKKNSGTIFFKQWEEWEE